MLIRTNNEQSTIRLLLFTSQSCSHCDVMRNNIIAANLGYSFEEIDNDSNANLVNLYGIKILPTLLLINDKAAERLVGAHDTQKIKEWVNGKEKT